MKLNKIFIAFLLIFSFTVNNVFADSSDKHEPEPYNTDEFPQALKDLRRFEIITLGSMPFVMLDVNLVYSGILYANGQTSSYSPLNMAKYDEKQQVGVLLTTIGISTGIGITDFVVQKIKAGKTKKRIKKQTVNSVNITPIEEDPDAIKIELPQEESESDELEDLE